jgi:hypothetical protein
LDSKFREASGLKLSKNIFLETLQKIAQEVCNEVCPA